jgi:dienelactone hydrolase
MRMARTQIAGLVASILLLTACGGGGGGTTSAAATPTPTPTPVGSTAFDFRAPSSDELMQVQTSWSQRDLSARGVSVADVVDNGSYKITIYSHRVGDNTHIGAVVVPNRDFRAPIPVLVLLEGLDQSNPVMRLDQSLFGYRNDAVLVIPLYRGRSLQFNNRTFSANGDFCDAYEGATDDTIALLNVMASTTPKADLSNVIVMGYSRGGNVALLMGERDPRVRTVIAGAGPTDFYRQEVRDHYGSQYTCQFFTDKTEAASRQKMLASSPLRFNMLATVSKVYVFHGASDQTVPLWNATEMQTRLVGRGKNVVFHSYPGFGHTDIFGNAIFVSEWNQARLDAIGVVE